MSAPGWQAGAEAVAEMAVAHAATLEDSGRSLQPSPEALPRSPDEAGEILEPEDWPSS